ncbi:uncharacterized protein BO72DRAFT_496822 [Aspergillus fijiensis CBS 313.89]|uniref:Rhodopsin domain-containing protein n=1 Tax=Aspergillus fijiensis CBS 313.89 TaxID=1448319 RepID=A0A8G1RPF9_9EURO|nr:uncharacterized protein BO72DRAFT_496822 [Aspergillus fijiensis CBS 313.89]RAK76914.1 hypothetical protein BO72DRAFT_496822 [Aspergillus fijiensis CBS 313.89]
MTTASLNQSAQSQTLGAIIPFAVLSIIAVVLRLLAKSLTRLRFGLDDYLIIVGLACSLGCFSLSTIMVALGSGRHLAVVPTGNIHKYLKCMYAYQMIYTATILSVKLSILTYYVRIFQIRPFRIAVYVVGSLVVAWAVIVWFISIFSCRPLNGFWDKSVPATCVSSKAFYVGNAVPNICTDVMILILPLRMVWGLQTTRIQKVTLSAIFLLGGFVVVCSCIRLSTQFKVDDPDFTWAMNGTVIWTSLEVSFGVISACLPTMRPIVRWAMRKLNIEATDTSKSSQRYFPSNHVTARGFETLSGSGGEPQTHQLHTTAVRSNSRTESNNGEELLLGQIQVKNEVRFEAESV